jgi:hypothetical protein
MKMALTLEAQQRLENVNLTTLFEQKRAQWERLAKQAFQFIAKGFPEGVVVHPDDVAKALVPLLEVNKDLSDYLAANKLKQKYWVRDFCDLVLDRSWQKLPS